VRCGPTEGTVTNPVGATCGARWFLVCGATTPEQSTLLTRKALSVRVLCADRFLADLYPYAFWLTKREVRSIYVQLVAIATLSQIR